jgi:hypothetical protein
MALTYDQVSEIRMAFQEAHVPSDRRRSQRVRHHVPAEITEWENNKAGRSFGVTIDDFSMTGVGIMHSGKLQLGKKYLLEIPRPGKRPLPIVLKVVRCAQTDGGMFEAKLEFGDADFGGTDMAPRKSSGSKVGILIAGTMAAAAAGVVAYYFL